jgi:hypothetical protein
VISKRTNSMKPDERMQGILPLLEFLSVNKPCASCRLPQLAGVIMVRRGVGRSQPLVNLPPKFVCNGVNFVKSRQEGSNEFTCHVVI